MSWKNERACICLVVMVTFVLLFITISDVFQQVGWKVFSDEELVVLLRSAVGNSRKKHYHGGKGIEVLSPEGN